MIGWFWFRVDGSPVEFCHGCGASVWVFRQGLVCALCDRPAELVGASVVVLVDELEPVDDEPAAAWAGVA